MNIEINGLGVVKNAKIDLAKKLIVFTGLNSTGKTYVSYLIYALTSRQRLIPAPLADEDMAALLDAKSLRYSIEENKICSYRRELVASVTSNLHEIFGISKEQSATLFKSFSVAFQSSDKDFIGKVRSESFEAQLIGNDFKITGVKDADSMDVMLTIDYEGTLSHRSLDVIRYAVLPNIHASLALHPIPRSVIFPVERNSIYTFSKELSLKRTLLVDEMQNLNTKTFDPVDFFNKRSTRYPQPIRDGLEVAEDLTNLKKQNSPFLDFATELEEELLQGKVSVSSDGEVQFASDKAKSKKLPIHLTASIVKTLSSLVFYLKHLAMKGDLIIIDEPELNLHPDNQVVLARIFSRLINAGFRIILSTHSDYIIRELNNLIMLSSDKPSVNELRERYGYRDNERISPEDVGAYFFDFKSKTTVTALPLPVAENGFSVPSIDRTIEKINAVSEDLYFALTQE